MAPRPGALVAALFLVACSGSSNGTGPEGGTPDVGVEHADGTGGSVCGRTALAAKASIAVHLPTGDLSCANAPTDAGPGKPPLTWSGVVTSSDAASITVDTCDNGDSDAGADAGPTDADSTDADSTDAGCSTGSIRVEATAPGLDLSRFPHVRVRVRVSVSRFYACQQALEITASGTQGALDALLLAVVDGGTTFDGSPYLVARVPLGCPKASSCNANLSITPDEYAFDFSTPGASTLHVLMGDTASWALGASTYTVRNLRSFQSCATDDYWNWAYTIYADPK
jgi:hypothetical protein